MIDEHRSPAARRFNATHRALLAALGHARRQADADRRFINAMRHRPLTRPEARITQEAPHA